MVKPAVRQQVHDRPREVAAAEEPLLQRLEAMLPAPDALVGRQPVLDEVQGRSGLEDASHLLQRGRDVGDRAERPRRDRGVEAVVVEGQRLAVEARPLDRRRATPGRARRPGFQPTSAGSTAATRVTAVRVERDVEPRAEADLDDVALEAGADAAPKRVVGLHPARGVDDPWEDVLAVESHW